MISCEGAEIGYQLEIAGEWLVNLSGESRQGLANGRIFFFRVGAVALRFIQSETENSEILVACFERRVNRGIVFEPVFQVSYTSLSGFL